MYINSLTVSFADDEPTSLNSEHSHKSPVAPENETHSMKNKFLFSRKIASDLSQVH